MQKIQKFLTFKIYDCARYQTLAVLNSQLLYSEYMSNVGWHTLGAAAW